MIRQVYVRRGVDTAGEKAGTAAPAWRRVGGTHRAAAGGSDRMGALEIGHGPASGLETPRSFARCLRAGRTPRRNPAGLDRAVVHRAVNAIAHGGLRITESMCMNTPHPDMQHHKNITARRR